MNAAGTTELMDIYALLDADLTLFEGDGGDGGGESAAAEAAGESTQAAAEQPGSRRREKEQGPFANVRFGKQDAPDAPAAEAPETQAQETPDETPEKSKEARRREFQRLVNAEYKDIYTEETQRMLNRRHAETETLRSRNNAMQPLLDALSARYGVEADPQKLTEALNSDTAFWAEAAENAGMTVEQYRHLRQMEAQNAQLLAAERSRQQDAAARQQLDRWYAEAARLRGTFPDFDLDRESDNPQFLGLLRAGVPMEHAYRVIHMDDMMSTAIRTAAAQTEKAVVENVRSRGARPAENGTLSQSAFTVRDDVRRLTKAERAEIARRAARGEKITF